MNAIAPAPTPGPTLRTKRQKFVSAYVGEAHGNATKAATLAGYGCAKQAGSRLLTKVDVREAIDLRLKRASASAERTLWHVAQIAYTDTSDLWVVDPETKRTRFDIERAKATGRAFLIERVIPGPFGDSIVLHSKTAALSLLAKYQLVQRAEVELTTSDARSELQARLSQLAERLAAPRPATEPNGLALLGTVGNPVDVEFRS